MKKDIQIIQAIRKNIRDELREIAKKSATKIVRFNLKLEDIDYSALLGEKLKYLKILEREGVIGKIKLYTEELDILKGRLVRPSNLEIEKNPDAIIDYLDQKKHQEEIIDPPRKIQCIKGVLYSSKLADDGKDNPLFIKNIILIESKSKILFGIVLNENYRNVLVIKRKTKNHNSPWNILRRLSYGEELDFEQNKKVYTYINSSKACPLYKNTGFIHSPIFKRIDDKLILNPRIKVEVISEATLVRRRNKK